jgi:hypothetical protein
MGFGRRLVRKTVRKATPRPVRRAMHPVRTVRYAATPRPVRQVSRAVYTVTNPLGAAENKLIGAALSSGSRRRASPSRGGPSTRSRSAPASRGMSGTGVRAAEAVASHDQLAQLMIVQRERFTAARRPLVPDPSPVDPKPFQQQEWERRKRETHLWQRARRRQLRTEAVAFGRAAAADPRSTLAQIRSASSGVRLGRLPLRAASGLPQGTRHHCCCGRSCATRHGDRSTPRAAIPHLLYVSSQASAAATCWMLSRLGV